LRKIIYIFAEPPTLRELDLQQLETCSKWFGHLHGDNESRGRGQHGYVTLVDSQLARLLRVDNGYFGRTLRLSMLKEHTGSGTADPDTAIKEVFRPKGRTTYVPSGEQLPAKIRLDGTQCEVLGIRRGPRSDTSVRWVAHFSTSDDALAPVLLPEGEPVPARSRVHGGPKTATVVSRTARALRVRLSDKGGNETERDVVVGDLPHVLKPGDEITVSQVDERGEKLVVLDVPHGHATSDPIAVIVSSATDNKWTVRPERSPDENGTLVFYSLPFEVMPLNVGDRVLAIEIFNDPNTANESERRLYLALSSALPAVREGDSPDRLEDGESTTVSVTYYEVPDE